MDMLWVYRYFSILVFGSIATASRHMRSRAGSDPYEGVRCTVYGVRCTVPYHDSMRASKILYEAEDARSMDDVITGDTDG